MFKDTVLQALDSLEEPATTKQMDESVRKDLKHILNEHLDAFDGSNDMFAFYVGTEDNHVLHIAKHQEFLDRSPGISIQMKSAMAKHIDKHRFALDEAKNLGLLGSFQSAFEELV